MLMSRTSGTERVISLDAGATQDYYDERQDPSPPLSVTPFLERTS